jgi:hypothetical protein
MERQRTVKCKWCKRDINRGTELQKAIAEYQQEDKSIELYGWDREAGKLPMFGGKPKGRLVAMMHYKCFRFHEKRYLRGGDHVTGRGIGSIPTAYEVGALTANLDELKALGLTEEEARAVNTREFSERAAKLREEAKEKGLNTESWEFKRRIREEAAKHRQEQIAADRAQDPGHQEPTESDWRDQQVMDVSDVPDPEALSGA